MKCHTFIHCRLCNWGGSSSEAGKSKRSDAEMVHGLSVVSPGFGWSATGNSGWEGGEVVCLGIMGSGMKDLHCKAISAFRRQESSLSSVNK